MNSESANFDSEVGKLLEYIAKNEEFTDCKIQKETVSMKGFGYLGVLTPIELIGKDKSGKDKRLRLVVKSASKSDVLRGEIPISSVFDREIYAYTTVIPALQKFESEKIGKAVPLFAKCYKACKINKSETLILDNLRSHGFKLWDKKIPMDESHTSFVMEQFGRFHAISYAIKDQNPEMFDKLAQPLHEMFEKFSENPHFGDLFIKHCEKALNSLNPTTDQEIFQIFETFSNSGVDLVIKRLLIQTNDKYSAILHGDSWTNNMMFKYDSNSSKPSELKLIDFQIMRLGSPVLDLSYYFYSCCSKEAINNLDYYLKIYHGSLFTHLRALGSDPDKLYPYSVLQKQWKETSKFGLIMAFILIHIMLTEQDEFVDLSDIVESGEKVMNAYDYDITNKDVYNDRVRHLVLHAVENKFI